MSAWGEGSGCVYTRRMQNVGPRFFVEKLMAGLIDDGKWLNGYVETVHLRYFLLHVNWHI